MKILYVITSTDVGGAEKALLGLVRRLSTDPQIQVKVISLKPLGKVGYRLQKVGAQVLSYHMKGLGLEVVGKLRKDIQSFQPDIVHAMLFRAIEYTRLACPKNSCKLLTTMHFDLSKKNLFLRKIDSFLKYKDFISLAESQNTFNFLVKKQNYPKRRVLLIQNSPEKQLFFNDFSIRKEMRTRFNYTSQNCVFLSVARLVKEKNPQLLLKAFYQVWQKYPQTRLVYVGEGYERKRLEQFIKNNNLQKAVFLAGEQPQINDWLNMADFFVLPSIEESLPMALLEALQVGKPCIASAVGDIPLWVRTGENGYLIPPHQKEDLIKALSFCTVQTNLWDKMQKESLKKAENIKDSIEEHFHLYQKIMEESFHVKTLN